MSWIIKDRDGYGYFCGFAGTAGHVVLADREVAKRFETKQDAKGFNDQYNLNGHIIPA